MILSLIIMIICIGWLCYILNFFRYRNTLPISVNNYVDDAPKKEKPIKPEKEKLPKKIKEPKIKVPKKNHKPNKKILLYLLYFLFVLSFSMLSITLAKYSTSGSVGGGMNIGQLYLGYERGDLFRNDILIVGVEVTEDGKTRIETMNVKPNDVLTYYFRITNYLGKYDELTNELIEIEEANNVSATYTIKVYAKLLLPVVRDENDQAMIVDLDCQITELVDAGTGTYSAVDTTQSFNLPACTIGQLNTYFVKQYRVLVEETQQLQNLTSKDYFGASLQIYINFNAIQNQPIEK